MQFKKTHIAFQKKNTQNRYLCEQKRYHTKNILNNVLCVSIYIYIYIYIYRKYFSYILYAKVVQIEFPITKTDRFCLLEAWMYSTKGKNVVHSEYKEKNTTSPDSECP